MGFEVDRFENTRFTPRTEEVRVEALKAYFGKSEPVWVVRGATSEETFRAAEAKAKQVNMAAMVSALVSDQAGEGDKIESIKQALGMSGKSVPGELAKRLELLTMCSVEPKIGMSVAVKLAEAFPIPFYTLTNTIIELTSKGQKTEEKP